MGDEMKSYKLIIIGDTGVGKTSITNKKCTGTFSIAVSPTVGTWHLKTTVAVADQTVELKIWDTAGQEQFASLVPMYARGSQVCIIVGSFVDSLSIDHINVWAERLHEAGEFPPIIVAINKLDLAQNALLTETQIREKIDPKYYDNLFFVSARSGDGLPELFSAAAQEATKYSKSEQERTKLVEKNKSSCC